jgi:hypothetical protein
VEIDWSLYFIQSLLSAVPLFLAFFLALVLHDVASRFIMAITDWYYGRKISREFETFSQSMIANVPSEEVELPDKWVVPPSFIDVDEEVQENPAGWREEDPPSDSILRKPICF